MSSINIEELTSKIKEMTEDGFTPSKISVILDIKVTYIRSIVKENNFTIKKESFDESKIERIIDLYERGVGKNRLSKKFSIDGRRILRWAEERGVRRTQEEARRIIQFNENYFDEINTPDKAYWLGFLYADGCNHGNYRVTISLQQSDYEQIEKFANVLNYPKRTITYSEGTTSGFGGNGSVNISINSTHMASALSRHGCVPAKSHILTYPEWIDKDLEVHFIRGLFDGDGSCNLKESYGEWSWSIAGTKNICEGVQKAIQNKFDFISRIEKRTSIYNIVVNGNSRIHKIMEWLYSCSTHETRLNRKYNTYLKLTEFQNNRTFTRKAYKVSDEEKIQILEKVNSGHQISEIAQEFKLHPRTITTIINKSDNSLFNKIIIIDDKQLTKKYIESLSLDERENLSFKLFKYLRNQGFIYPDSTVNFLYTYKLLCDKTFNLNNTELDNNTSFAVNICKYFCKSFYNTTERNGKTAIDVWNDDALLMKAVRYKLGLDYIGTDKPRITNITPAYMFQALRDIRLIPQISIFKPTIAKYISLKYSEPGDVIGDYSAGFGGRLLGAMSCGRKYIATDPLTVPELEEMVDFFGFKNCKLIQSGSEYYRGDKNSVDLYYSSPPYYDQEYYSSDETQAYNKGEDYFYNVYWKNTLENIKYMLKPNKWFGLNIKNQPLMLEMAVEYFGKIEDKLTLKTARSHLTKKGNVDNHKFEYVYMFKNRK